MENKCSEKLGNWKIKREIPITCRKVSLCPKFLEILTLTVLKFVYLSNLSNPKYWEIQNPSIPDQTCCIKKILGWEGADCARARKNMSLLKSKGLNNTTDLEFSKLYFLHFKSKFFRNTQPKTNPYTGETGVGKTKLRDYVRVYQQHIKQPEYQKRKVEEHLRTCGKGTFKIFPLLQMRSSEIDLRRSYERNFMKKIQNKIK